MNYSWYRLDNSAIVYQMVLTPETQSIFRMGVKLTSPINKEILLEAVKTALVRFPFFKTELKRGFFRPYLDENPLPPVVNEDNGLVLNIFNFAKNNHYLFRTSYYGNRFFIDFFHGLCDGTGAMEFFKSVLYYYCEKIGNPISDKNIRTLNSSPSKEEFEDSFDKYYKKVNVMRGTKSMAGGTAYKIRGKQFRNFGFGFIQATVDTDSLLNLARKHNCSITVYLAALILLAIAKTNVRAPQKHNMVAFIPINLRKRFPSDTLGNFTVFAKCIIPKDTEYTLENLIEVLKQRMSEQLDEREMQLKLSFSSLMAKLLPLKIMPLFFKSVVSRMGRRLTPGTKQTFILSNLGKLDIDQSENIDHFWFNLNCSKKTPNNIGIVSYKDKTVISFTRKIISTEIEREVLSTLASELGNVDVISNLREQNHAL